MLNIMPETSKPIVLDKNWSPITYSGEEIYLELPYPPSVNNYWGWNSKNSKVFLKNKARTYKEMVYFKVKSEKINSISGLICVNLKIIPPDKRIRDIDNGLKAIFDSLQYAGIYKNDNSIKYTNISFLDPSAHGLVKVYLYPIN